MDLEKIFLKILSEQEINADLDNNFEDIEPEEHDAPYVSPYNTNAYKVVKQKWVKEVRDLTEIQIDNAIDVFNRKKNNLRPFREDINAENVQFQGIPNLPEVISLKHAFPQFPSDDLQKLKDINSYSWRQFEFFTDRFNTENNDADIVFNAEGDTEEERINNAYKLWEGNHPSKIIHENGIIVHKITGKDEAIAFGKLQHMLNRKFKGSYNDWCITNPAPGNTFYNNYRDRRSYYFVLKIGDRGTNKEKDPYYLSVLQPSNGYEGPYVITPRPNGDQVRNSWNDVLRHFPQLEGKEELFKYFPKTNKEKYESVLDIVNFRPNDRNHFILQSRPIQNRYIESGRNINDLKSIQVFTKEQLNSYIRGTNMENYKQRFISSNASKPFEILNFIEKNNPSKYTEIDNYIKGRLNVASGIMAIKNYIMLKNFKIRLVSETDPKIEILVNEDVNNIGLYNRTKEEFILPPVYIEKGRIMTYTEKFNEKYQQMVRNNFIVVKYEISDEFISDYKTVNIDVNSFYSVYLTKNANKEGNEKYHCRLILDEQAGNKLWRAINKGQ